jgi:hypothetical protein
MRYDNDVTNARRNATRLANFVRTSLTDPRRSAALGLAAAVGTGALMLTGAPAATAHSAAAVPASKAAMVTQAASRNLDRGKITIKPAAKTATAGKAATAGKGAAARTNAMLHTSPVAGLDKTQMKNAALIVKAGRDLGISERGQIVAMSTAMQESNLYNRASHVVPESLKYDHQGTGSDYDSVGLFQQRYTTGWGTVKSIMNPEQSATKFYQRLLQVDGWQNMPVTVAAQTVQGSAFPDAYAKHQAAATQVVHAINKTAAKH